VQSNRLPHEPALDGLRGLAVAGVVCYHLALLDGLANMGNVTRGGFLGVSAFFTLSGFLITSLLLLEFQRDDRISFLSFWGRRARRLLPAALLTLATVALVARWMATPAQLENLKEEIFSALTYVANWRFILSHNDYAAMFTGQSPVKHLWSLSIEEEWYVIVPLLVFGTLKLRRGRRDLLAVFLVAGAALTIGLGWWLDHGAYSNRVYLGTDTRFPELAIGALLAVAIAGKPIQRLGLVSTVRRLGRTALDLASAVIAIGLLAVWATTDLESSWLYRGGFALHAAAVAVVIAAAVRPGTVVNRVFRWRPLAALGRISYGVYLFHWPLILWMTPARLHLEPAAAAVVQTISTLALATLSFFLIEKPIRSGRLVVNWRRIAIPAIAVGAVVLLVVYVPSPDRSLLTAPLSSDRRVVTRATPPPSVSTVPVTAGSAAATTTTTTLPPPPVRVMVVGDSFAISLIPGLDHTAMSTGQIAVLNAAVVGCAFGRGGWTRALNYPMTFSPTCQHRDTDISQHLSTFHPDIVVVAGGLWDASDRRLAGTKSWVHLGEPGYDTYLSGEFQHLADLVQSSGAQLVWLTSPDWNPAYVPADFMLPGPYAEANPARVVDFNQILTAALAGRPRAQILDIAGWLKAQPGGEFAPTLRADGVHFTQTSTDTAAGWLVPQLLSIVRGSTSATSASSTTSTTSPPG
jgi:peptidoglycan/LPS O-acetylase OafA/YrhL